MLDKLAFRFIAVALIATFPAMRICHASNKVGAPDVVEGRTDFEYRFGRDFDSVYNRDHQTVHKFVIGHGVTDWWNTGGKVVLLDDHGDYDFTFLEWGNKFQLIKGGTAWPRLAVFENYKYALQPGIADRLEFGVQMGKDFGKWANLANVNFESEIGSRRRSGMIFNVALKTRYLWTEHFEPGFEVYQDLGTLTEANFRYVKRSLAGPTVSGNLDKTTRYDAGVLFGTSDAASDMRLKLILTKSF